MNIQLYQIVSILVWTGAIIFAWKIKNHGLRILLIILGILFFIANPIRFKQEGIAKLEKNISKFSNIPKKEVILRDTFEERQKKEMNNLKLNSEGLKNEIHD